jgi:mRNA-degrading endonuclease RelE of RelBE toxin-antitoxin system
MKTYKVFFTEQAREELKQLSYIRYCLCFKHYSVINN